MNDALVEMSLFFAEARDAVAALFGSAEFSFENRIVFRADYGEVK